MAADEITEYLKRAFEYKNNGDYKEAIDYFYKALAMDNNSIEIMRELADMYTRLCRYDRAVSFYEQILAKDSRDYSAKYNLAEIYRLKKEYALAEKYFIELYDSEYEIEKIAVKLFPILIYNKQYQELISLFNQYINKLKDSMVLYYAAYSYEKTGNKTLAEEYYNKSYESDKNNINACIHIAYNLLENNNIQEAESLCHKLLKNGENEELYVILAEIAYLRYELDNALKYYSYAIRINPQNADNYFRIAVIFSLKGYFSEAEESYCKAITLEPENITYNYALAYMYYTEGKYELAENLVDFILNIKDDDVQTMALKIILKTIKDEASDIQALVNKLNETLNSYDFAFYALAVYYEKINKPENALCCIEKAEELNPDSTEYKYLKAKIYLILNKTEQAKKICNEILEKENKYVQALIMLAEISLKEKNYKDAVLNAEKALELDKNFYGAYFVIAEVNYEMKNYEKALENYKIAISIRPDEEQTYARIAHCNYFLKNYKEAYIYYKEAADFDVSNPLYRYYMAKCCENTGDKESAVANYSVMKRLDPYNIKYIKEYSDYLYSLGRKQKAKQILSSLMNKTSAEEQTEIKKIIKSYK